MGPPPPQQQQQAHPHPAQAQQLLKQLEQEQQAARRSQAECTRLRAEFDRSSQLASRQLGEMRGLLQEAQAGRRSEDSAALRRAQAELGTKDGEISQLRHVIAETQSLVSQVTEWGGAAANGINGKDEAIARLQRELDGARSQLQHEGQLRTRAQGDLRAMSMQLQQQRGPQGAPGDAAQAAGLRQELELLRLRESSLQRQCQEQSGELARLREQNVEVAVLRAAAAEAKAAKEAAEQGAAASRKRKASGDDAPDAQPARADDRQQDVCVACNAREGSGAEVVVWETRQGQEVLGRLEATARPQARRWLPKVLAIDFFFTGAALIHAVLLTLVPAGPEHTLRPAPRPAEGAGAAAGGEAEGGAKAEAALEAVHDYCVSQEKVIVNRECSNGGLGLSRCRDSDGRSLLKQTVPTAPPSSSCRCTRRTAGWLTQSAASSSRRSGACWSRSSACRW